MNLYMQYYMHWKHTELTYRRCVARYICLVLSATLLCTCNSYYKSSIEGKFTICRIYYQLQLLYVLDCQLAYRMAEVRWIQKVLLPLQIESNWRVVCESMDMLMGWEVCG